MRSSRVRSVWRTSSLRCCSSVPPAPWTMHLGRPVVPERVHDVEGVVERAGGRRTRAAAGPRPWPSAQSSHSHRSRNARQVRPARRDTAPPPPARSRGSARTPRAPEPASRSPCRRSGSRRRRRGLGARSGRSGRARRWRRSRASRRTRSRRGSRWRAWRSRSRGGWAGSRRRGRPAAMPCARSARRDAADLVAELAIGERPLPALLVPEHQRLARRPRSAAGSRRS